MKKLHMKFKYDPLKDFLSRGGKETKFLGSTSTLLVDEQISVTMLKQYFHRDFPIFTVVIQLVKR